MNNKTTQYRLIEGHPSHRVGSDGSIWSCLEKVRSTKQKGFVFALSSKWRRMKPGVNPDGYRSVKIAGKRIKVSKLVLEAFYGPRPDGMECRHLNNRRDDDRASNLAWGTHKENIADKKRHGTHQAGVKHAMHKLTEAQVLAIRQAYIEGGVTQRELARQYGVSQGGCIGPILRRKNWSHLA